MRKLFLLGLPLVLLASACVTDHGRFTVVALSKIDFKDYDSKTSEKTRNVTKAQRRQIVIVVPATDGTLEGAVADVCGKNNGDFLTDAHLWERWFFAPGYAQTAYYARGDVVKLNDQLAPGTTSSSSEKTQEPRD